MRRNGHSWFMKGGEEAMEKGSAGKARTLYLYSCIIYYLNPRVVRSFSGLCFFGHAEWRAVRPKLQFQNNHDLHCSKITLQIKSCMHALLHITFLPYQSYMAFMNDPLPATNHRKPPQTKPYIYSTPWFDDDSINDSCKLTSI